MSIELALAVLLLGRAASAVGDDTRVRSPCRRSGTPEVLDALGPEDDAVGGAEGGRVALAACVGPRSIPLTVVPCTFRGGPSMRNSTPLPPGSNGTSVELSRELARLARRRNPWSSRRQAVLPTGQPHRRPGPAGPRR